MKAASTLFCYKLVFHMKYVYFDEKIQVLATEQ